MPQLSVIVPLVSIEGILDSFMSLVSEIARLEYLTQGQVETLFIDNSPNCQLGDPIKEIVGDMLCNWMIFVSTPNSVSEARNEGIKRSTGEYLAFVDADDGIDADAYAQTMRLACKAHIQIDIIFMNYAIVKDPIQNKNRDRKQISEAGRIFPVEKKQISKYAIDYIFSPRSKNPITHCWSSLLRRATINEHCLYFDSKYNQLEDIHFVCKMLLLSKNVYSTDLVAYRHNIFHPNRLSRQSFFPEDITDFISKQTMPVLSILHKSHMFEIEHLTSTMISNHIIMFYIRALSDSKVFDSGITRILYTQPISIDQICHFYTANPGETVMLPSLLLRRLPHIIVWMAWWLKRSIKIC